MDGQRHPRGRHILKGGTKVRRWLPHFTDSKQYQGVWTYNGFATQNPSSPTGTGDAFADFMLGYPRQVQRALSALTAEGVSKRNIGTSASVSDGAVINCLDRMKNCSWRVAQFPTIAIL